MLKRPSSRRKSRPEEIILNLVPVLDTMVALIAFMLFTMSFLVLVSVESPFPEASTEALEKALREKPLQLTLTLREDEAEIWSPFDMIPSKRIPNPAPGQPDLRAVHNHLIAIKQKYPLERKLVIVPYASASYDVMIAVMDAARLMEAGDPPIFTEGGGTPQSLKTLFPDVIFGNLLGDT